MLLPIIFALLFFLFLVFFFLPLKILWQGNFSQTEIKLLIFNLSFFKGILSHKHLSFETNFFKKKKITTIQKFLEKIFQLFFKKKSVKNESVALPAVSSTVNSKGKKKGSAFFRSYKKKLKKTFINNILGLIKKIVFSFKIQKLELLLSFEQTPYIGVFYRVKLCLPLKYRKNIHISFFESFRYQLTSRVFVGKFLFSLLFWFLRLNLLVFFSSNKK